MSSFASVPLCLLLAALLWGPGARTLPQGKAAPAGPVPFELHYPAYFGNRFTIPAGNPTTREGVHLGRLLFYETRLSANNGLSCGSCHEQRRAFTDGRARSRGVDGTLTRRNAMSLANLLWVRNLFWDGRAAGLEAQAVVPLTDAHEMGQSLDESARKLAATDAYPPLFRAAFGPEGITGENIAKALAQFERTLISANARYDRYLAGKARLSAPERRGLELFTTAPAPSTGIRGANCGHCHGGPKTMVELFHNNGLDSLPPDPGRQLLTGRAADRGRFRVPTLRNIALTAPYMHDGRFATLAEVLDHYSDHLRESPHLSTFLRETNRPAGSPGLRLTAPEKEALVAFLHTLTDSTFIGDPRYANPHPKPLK